MKAIVIPEVGDASVLVYTAVPQSELGFGEVRVEVKASAVNYIDTLIRSGQMPPGAMPQLPFVPGVECVGHVVELGEGVSDLQVGDKVAYFGKIGASTYAQYVQAPADAVVKIPGTVNNAEAAAVPVNYTTAYHMLHNMAKVSKGQTVLIHAAAGGVGTALIQLSARAGLSIIASVGSEEKMKYVLNEGAHFAVNYKTEDLVARVNALTNGKGVDVSFNPVSGDSMLNDLKLLTPFGHLVVFGFIAGLPTEPLQQAMLQQFNKSLTVSYSDIYTLYQQHFDGLKKILSELYQLLDAGKIRPQVFKQLSLSEASAAHNLLESGKVVGKLVLVP